MARRLNALIVVAFFFFAVWGSLVHPGDAVSTTCEGAVLAAVDRTYKNRVRASVSDSRSMLQLVLKEMDFQSTKFGILSLLQHSAKWLLDINTTAATSQNTVLSMTDHIVGGPKHRATNFWLLFRKYSKLVSEMGQPSYILIFSDFELLHASNWKALGQEKTKMSTLLGNIAPKIVCYRVRRATNTTFLEEVCDHMFYSGMDQMTNNQIAVNIKNILCATDPGVTNITHVYTSSSAVAAVTSQGSVVTWGPANVGGDSSTVSSSLASGFGVVYTNDAGMVAKNLTGGIVVWGGVGDISSVAADLQSGVVSVYSTDNAFGVIKSGGQVVTWGAGTLNLPSTELASGVEDVYTTASAFLALKNNRTKIVCWGDRSKGGDCDSITVPAGTSVVKIFTTDAAAAALLSNGNVLAWGSPDSGGTVQPLESVEKIFSNPQAFAAVKTDGTVVAWGSSEYGGDTGTKQSNLTDVDFIVSNVGAFAAVKKTDGSVVTWGKDTVGADSSSVATKLFNVTSIASTRTTFAALRQDGKVISWGIASKGGDSGTVTGLDDVVSVLGANQGAYAALKKDGSVVAWGSHDAGGSISTVSTDLTSGVAKLYSTDAAFIALKDDGSVVTWGASSFGGDSSSVFP